MLKEPTVELCVCVCVFAPLGYVYLVFESDKSVRALLHACSQDPFHPEDNREFYFKMSSRRMRCKDVSRPHPPNRRGHVTPPSCPKAVLSGCSRFR